MRAVRGRAAVYDLQKVRRVTIVIHASKTTDQYPATGNRHLTKMDLKRSFIAHSNSVASYQGSRRALLLGGNKALGGGAMMGIRKVSARPASSGLPSERHPQRTLVPPHTLEAQRRSLFFAAATKALAPDVRQAQARLGVGRASSDDKRTVLALSKVGQYVPRRESSRRRRAGPQPGRSSRRQRRSRSVRTLRLREMLQPRR